MTDFDAELKARLARNEQLAAERQRAEAEMDRALEQTRADQERQRREREAAQRERHAELVAHLRSLAVSLKDSSPDEFIVRTGWTPSGEEFIAKLSTRGMSPNRSLFIELDRDDDEVLVRWTGELGSSVELWRLLEFEPALLSQLVLQIADQQLWHGRTSPPPFPGG